MFRTTFLRLNRSLLPGVGKFEKPKMSPSATKAAPVESNGAKKRAFDSKPHYRFKSNKRFKKTGNTSEGTHEEVLMADVRALLQKFSIEGPPVQTTAEHNGAPSSPDISLPALQTELELTVSEISSTGDGLALSPDSDHVYVIPFSAPGDVVKAKVFKHSYGNSYSLTDFIRVVKPSELRDESLVKCPYFSSCSGCQFQMLPYDYQLAHKKRIVEKAYRNFSSLPAEHVPEVGDTIGSPLLYGYRTKLTPHFDGPPNSRRSDRRKGIKPKFEQVPPIGFMKKNTRITIDIEECPIGTEAVRLGMKRERKRVAEQINTYSKGATVLLRENTRRILKQLGDGETNPEATAAPSEDVVLEDRGDYINEKSCTTDSNSKTTEYIDDFIFVNPAGAFFQNNNSILPAFTSYVRRHILPRDSTEPKITNLVDAYCGSGLFTITFSSLFTQSLGIDISSSSIESANTNARLNNLPPSQASFMSADAADLFAKIAFPPAETVVVIDPPRKGCDESFLRQLLKYSPARVVYVSCNVHTQARDVGVLVSGMEGVDGGFGVGEGVYEIESLRGFDFFPQTGHVEGVAVLRKRRTHPIAKTEGP